MPLIEPSINGGYLLRLINFLRDQGVQLDQLFKQIPQLSAFKEIDWVSAKDLNQVYQIATLSLADPLLGIKFGQNASTNSFSLVGVLAASAMDGLSAINSVLCYQRLYSRIGRMELRRKQDNVFLCWDAIWPRKLMHPAAVEASIAGWHQLGLKESKSKIEVKQITFSHDIKGCIEEYEQAFKCPVIFNQPFDAIYIDQKALVEPRLQADRLVYQALLEKAQALLTTHGHVPIIEEAENLLMQDGKGKILSIDQVAEKLGLNLGQFRRSIKQSGTSFRHLLDRCKFIESLDYLLDERMDLTDVAFELGFSESSGFTRAFKRWTNESPVAYRSKLLAIDY